MKMENGKWKMENENGKRKVENENRKPQMKMQNYYGTSPKIVGILILSTLAEGVVFNVDRSSNSTGIFPPV